METVRWRLKMNKNRVRISVLKKAYSPCRSNTKILEIFLQGISLLSRNVSYSFFNFSASMIIFGHGTGYGQKTGEITYEYY